MRDRFDDAELRPWIGTKIDCLYQVSCPEERPVSPKEIASYLIVFSLE